MRHFMPSDDSACQPWVTIFFKCTSLSAFMACVTQQRLFFYVWGVCGGPVSPLSIFCSYGLHFEQMDILLVTEFSRLTPLTSGSLQEPGNQEGARLGVYFLGVSSFPRSKRRHINAPVCLEEKQENRGWERQEGKCQSRDVFCLKTFE